MITHYGANLILNHLVGRASSPSIIPSGGAFIALSSTTPNKDGTGFTEPSGNGYARVLLGNAGQALTQKMTNATDSETENNEIIYFPEATGSWGTLTYFGIFTSGSTGQLVAYGVLTSPINPTTNTVPMIRVGELIISID